MNHQLTQLVIVVVAFSLLFGFILEVLWRIINAMVNMGKTWVITLPGTPGALATMQRRHLKDAKVETKDGEEGKTWIATGEAAYPSNKGPIHILTDYGANLVAPSKDAVATAIEEDRYKLPGGPAKAAIWARRFLVWDPLLLWRSNRENDMEDLYSSPGEKDPWYARVFPLVIILLLGLAGAFIFMIWKILPTIAAANHGG